MSSFTQDLPPKDGYRPFQIDRIPLRTVIGGRGAIALALATTIIGHYIYYLDWKTIKRSDFEQRSAVLAIKPILLAERDRAFLKQLKRNVEEEKELMRYIPAWKVGTFYGEPIYRTIPEDQYIEPDCMDFYAHANPDHYYKKHVLKLMN